MPDTVVWEHATSALWGEEKEKDWDLLEPENFQVHWEVPSQNNNVERDRIVDKTHTDTPPKFFIEAKYSQPRILNSIKRHSIIKITL